MDGTEAALPPNALAVILLPLDLKLALRMGMAVGDWHEENCDIPGCRLWMSGDRLRIVYTHSLPGERSDVG
jgi:hypothetical protein